MTGWQIIELLRGLLPLPKTPEHVGSCDVIDLDELLQMTAPEHLPESTALPDAAPIQIGALSATPAAGSLPAADRQFESGIPLASTGTRAP